jgi:hypothetical protein
VATNLLPKSTDACVRPCSSQDLPRHHSEVDRSILTSGGSYFLEQAEEVVATDSMGALDPSVASHADPPWTPASAFALDQAPSAPAAGQCNHLKARCLHQVSYVFLSGLALTWHLLSPHGVLA